MKPAPSQVRREVRRQTFTIGVNMKLRPVVNDCLVASFHRYAAKILGRKDKPFSTKDFCGAPVAQYRPIGAKRPF